MIRFHLLLPLLFLPLLHAKGQNIYLQYDENCMDRLEYSSSGSNNPFLVYSLKLGDSKFIHLDIGQEEGKWQRDLPGVLTNCRGIALDRDLVQKVNTGAVRLHVVRTNASNQYQIQPVEKASMFSRQNKTISFLMEDTEFTMYTDNLVSSINLARDPSQKEIYLEGTEQVQCLTAYIFRKRDDPGQARYKSYLYVPELGILERTVVENDVTFDSEPRISGLVLARVGKLTAEETISFLCDRLQSSHHDDSTSATPWRRPDLPAAYDSQSPCAPSGIEGIHVVQKGETIYGITRRYGLSPDQLRAWNGLQNTDILSICQQLYVKDPLQLSRPGAQPAPGNTAAPASGEVYWMNAPEVHVVKQGETLAALASLYGYTEARFRKMNGLGSAEKIYTGQKLRTSDCVCPTLESSTKDMPLPYEKESEKAGSQSDVYFRPVKVHLVKKEETLFSIARLHGTTVERIRELNGMSEKDRISPDQKIYVQ
jgi:LysM repeat protein